MSSILPIKLVKYIQVSYIMKKINFAENLKALRKQKGLTQKQLADIVAVDQRTISAWEKGVCEPSFQVLSMLCDIFEETFDEILT